MHTLLEIMIIAHKQSFVCYENRNTNCQMSTLYALGYVKKNIKNPFAWVIQK